MGLWWLLNCTSGRGILALWANCVPHLCQAKQAGNRREAGGDPLRLPPNLSRASGVGLSPNQCRPSGKPESAKKLFFLPPFPASAGTWHSFLPPSSESIALRNANKKDQISKSRVSAPPPGAGVASYVSQPPLSIMAFKAPTPSAPFLLRSLPISASHFSSMRSSYRLLPLGLYSCCSFGLEAPSLPFLPGVQQPYGVDPPANLEGTSQRISWVTWGKFKLLIPQTPQLSNGDDDTCITGLRRGLSTCVCLCVCACAHTHCVWHPGRIT